MINNTTPKEAARKFAAKKIQQGFKPEGLYEYFQPNGKPYWRIRLKHPQTGKKIFWSMHQTDEGEYVLKEPEFENKKPLYLSQEIINRPDETVWIHEGEKCTDASYKLGLLSTTSGGDTSAKDAEWSILTGRDVIIWPDNIEGGFKYADEVQKILLSLSCTIKIIDVSKLNIPEKGDIVDWLNTNPNATKTDLEKLPFVSKKNDNFPVPLPDLLPTVLPFDIEMLPVCIRDHIVDVAERQQCPIDFVAVTAICGLAAILGRKALIRPKQNDDWTITPNLWGAIIGRPSAMKSPAMKAALNPLKQIDAKAAKEHETAKEEHEVNKEIAEMNKTSARDAAKLQLKNGKNEDAKATLKAASFTDTPPKRKRLVVNDATVEKLGELLNENSNGLILVRDELSGWLAKLAREEYQMDRAFYLECFDGNGHYVYDRIGRGTIDIKNTTLSVIGGIQPSKISPLIRDAIRGVSDDGLVQRLQLAVWPDDIGNWKWIDRAPHEEARSNYDNTFDRLHALNFDTKDEEPPCFRFTLEAQKLFQEWMEEIQTIARKNDTHPALESHLLKMPQTIASLALLFQVLHNIHSDDLNASNSSKNETLLLAVEEIAIAQALEWADYLKSHAERLYCTGANQGLEGARLILMRFEKLKDEFTARDILRKEWTGLSDSRALEEALNYLIDYNHVTPLESPTTSSGGRPTTYYQKNKKYIKGDTHHGKMAEQN